MDSIIVSVDCDSYTPGLGETHFLAGTRIEKHDPNYFPLLWAGLAKPIQTESSGQPSTIEISARLKEDRDRAKESE